MLVLSRRPGEKILFPSLGVSVEVLRSRGSVIRLGIEAPDDIPVIRGEISREGNQMSAPAHSSANVGRHELRNQLNQVTLKLELLRRQLELGQVNEPNHSLEEAITDLMDLEHRIGDKSFSPAEASALRVLVVEDEVDARELLADCLRLTGMNVDTVCDGTAALEYLQGHEPPDLVLLDMRMPGIDGPTLLEMVRKDQRLSGVRVFAVSGSPRAEFPSAALEVDGWFSKPVRVDALIQAANLGRNSTSTTV